MSLVTLAIFVRYIQNTIKMQQLTESGLSGHKNHLILAIIILILLPVVFMSSILAWIIIFSSNAHNIFGLTAFLTTLPWLVWSFTTLRRAIQVLWSGRNPQTFRLVPTR
jgi:hypothetical protein